MGELRVSLLGRFSVEAEGQVLAGFDVRKAAELFCYLLLHRERPHSREVLAELLCAECSTAQARKFLRQALWQLQMALDPVVGCDEPALLLSGSDSVQLNPTANIWLDVAAFERCFAMIRQGQDDRLDAACASALTQAVELYRGDLLEGWYQDWCLFERERLQDMFLIVLDRLMAHCEAGQEYEHGLDYGERVLRYDRARERTHQRMMRLHYLAGDRTAALRQYRRCTTALQEELGVHPSQRTTSLYEQIRADHLEAALPASASQRETPPSSPFLGEVLTRLGQIEAVLAEVQRQLQQRPVLNEQPCQD